MSRILPQIYRPGQFTHRLAAQAVSYLPLRQADDDLHLRQTRSPAPSLSNDDRHFRQSRVFGVTSAFSSRGRSPAIALAMFQSS